MRRPSLAMMMLASVAAMGTVAPGSQLAPRPAAVAYAPGEASGIPWRWAGGGLGGGAGKKRLRVGKGRSSMAKRRNRRTHRKNWR